MSDWEVGENAPAVDTSNGFGDQGFDNTDWVAFKEPEHNVASEGPKTCNHCGKEGHFKRECPDIPEDQRGNGPGACFNCGEVGHNKAECSNPKVFKGACRICDKEGHPAKECPDSPAEVCKNCKEEGHVASECTGNRKLDFSKVKTMTPEDSWKLIEQASAEKDLDDFREALQIYVKSTPDVTYKQLEQSLRRNKMNVYIIALDKKVDDVRILMDIQGKLGMKYTVSYFYNPKCQRRSMLKVWPATPEENLERLENAGIPVDAYVLKCSNCREVGHTYRSCPQEKNEGPSKEIVCTNCEEVGHRMRDCPKPRPDKYACRNCNQRGHGAKECPEPPNPANVICKNCEKKGHFARDCPDRPPETCRNCGEEGHRAKECSVVKCRNCDGIGHVSKECYKPRDYTRIKCNNCGEMGHTKVRCKQPIKEETGNSGANFGGGFGDNETQAHEAVIDAGFGFEMGDSRPSVPDTAENI